MTNDGSSTPTLEAIKARQVYKLPRTSLFKPREELVAVSEANVQVSPGEVLGIVGESGGGKSTLSRMLVGYEKPRSGQVLFDGMDVWERNDVETRREIRRKVQIVLQNPRMSMDPRKPIGLSLLEPMRSLKVEGDYEARIREVLDQVGMGEDALEKYPHQFSGGQMQRIAIARALAPNPRVLIADEPVSALDVSIQAQVLNLLKDLVNDLDLSLVLIAHDLAVVAYMAHEVMVMSDGDVVEVGDPATLFNNPQAEATKELAAAALTVESGLRGESL
ncbi:MAG: ATP-binding cassette domain-containing protein [Nitriliruptoraceae bacterium]